jgi:hypothetical protein
MIELFIHPTYFTGRAIKGTWGNVERQKGKEMNSLNGLRLMDQNWSQPLTLR